VAIAIRMKAVQNGKNADGTKRWVPDAAGAWQYVTVPDSTDRGRRPEWLPAVEKAAKAGGRGFQYRVSGSQWSEQFPTIAEAEAAANGKSQVTVVDDHGSEIEGTSIRRAIDRYLEKKSVKSPRTVQNYDYILNEFLASLPRNIRTVQQITESVLTGYQRHIEKDSAPKTVVNKLMVVCFMLKHAGVQNPSSMVELPTIEEEDAQPYTEEELAALFSNMDDEEQVRYTFFLITACREQEVQHATWKDIDWKRNEYMVRAKMWKTASGVEKRFTTKNHQQRNVPLTDELMKMLRDRQKKSASPWIFPNTEGEPEGHFLRKFKAIAKQANLNCGDCVTRHVENHLGKKRIVEKSCLTTPVCEKHYLHRLRKTRATFWHEQGVPLRTIQKWLAHKSLDTTQNYLGVKDSTKLQKEINRPMYRVVA